MLVRFWMTRDPRTVGPDTPAAEALALMQDRKFRRLPVVDRGELVGIVTAENITSVLQYYAGRCDKAREARDFSRVFVKSVMAPSPFTTRSDELVAAVARLMRERKVGGIPVVDQGKLVGIITESDIFRALLGVLGVGIPGMPITFLLPREPEKLHEVMRLVKARDLAILTLTTIRDYSPTQQMVLMHVEGAQTAGLVSDLHGQHIEVLSVRET